MFLQVDEIYQDGAGKEGSRKNLVNMNEIASIVASDDGKTVFYMANQRMVDEKTFTGIIHVAQRFEVFESQIDKYANIGSDVYVKVYQKSVNKQGQSVMRPTYLNVHYVSNVLPDDKGEAVVLMCNYQVVMFEGKPGAIGYLETSKPYIAFMDEFHKAVGSHVPIVM